MDRRGRTLLLRPAGALLAGVMALGGWAGADTLIPPPSAAAATATTTAWSAGGFHVDTPNVVGRSDIVLGQPDTAAAQSMPLGNGMLGAAVWAAKGLSAQLNRVDTFPDAKSPGTLTVPGLAAMTGAPDYSGRVSLYDAKFTQSGRGMTATTYVRRDKDELIVDVSGADPDTVQTAQVQVPSTRSTTAAASGSIATLAESWVDDTWSNGNSNQTFGTLAALSVGGTSVTASVVNQTTIKVSFKPKADGTFRVVVGAPKWTGGNASTTASALLGSDATTAGIDSATSSWWHSYWAKTAMLELGSGNGEAEYLENLRMLDLFTQAASSSTAGNYPASHGGLANLFSSSGDGSHWCAACYWQWNLRMEVSANLGAGAFDANSPYFSLYRANLDNMKQWTTDDMGGRAGICVPETMRFNGNGWGWSTAQNKPLPDCSSTASAYYNSRTLSTGAEVGLWVWRQYQYTQDKTFLRADYPLMAEAATFLLAYATTDTNGHLQTSPSNAHETQWDTSNPTTDIAAMKALFPAVVQAAKLLSTDNTPGGLVDQLNTAIGKIRPFRHTTVNGADVIAMSDKDGGTSNVENIGLEPLWPYGVINDNSGADFQAEQRTYTNRDFVLSNDWAPDPVDAARLDNASEVRTQLLNGTARFQPFANGFDNLNANGGAGSDQYLEWNANVATALQDALVQADDGTLRVAPAWPSQWNAAGSVYIPGGHKVDVQYANGAPSTVAVEAGSTQNLTVRNPWPGQKVQVVDGTSTSTVVVAGTTAATFSLPLAKGHAYIIEKVNAPSTALTYARITGTRAGAARTLGGNTIGIAAPEPGPSGTVDIAQGRTTAQSSTLSNPADPTAAKAVDGSIDGNFPDGSVTHTNADADAWWQVDTGTDPTVAAVDLYNRTDCCGSRLSDYYVLVSDTPFTSTDLATTLAQPGVWSSHQTTQAGSPTRITVNHTGRYVRVQLDGTNNLSLAEVKVWGALGNHSSRPPTRA